MKTHLRFADLKARGIAKNWVQLKRMQEKYGFPKGRMLTPNCRTWTDEEIDGWTDSRPGENDQPLKGAATAEGRAKARATKAAKRARHKPGELAHPTE